MSQLHACAHTSHSSCISHIPYSCFISNIAVFFAAFLGPICLVLAFNAVIFVVVIIVLIKHVLKRSNSNNKNHDSIQLMINITSIFVLFGLTWIFGALTVLKADQTFQIMFTLINSLQGFLIFIFFCAMNKDVRLEWFQLVVSCHKKCSLSSQAHETTLQKADTDESAFTNKSQLYGHELAHSKVV